MIHAASNRAMVRRVAGHRQVAIAIWWRLVEARLNRRQRQTRRRPDLGQTSQWVGFEMADKAAEVGPPPLDCSAFATGYLDVPFGRWRSESYRTIGHLPAWSGWQAAQSVLPGWRQGARNRSVKHVSDGARRRSSAALSGLASSLPPFSSSSTPRYQQSWGGMTAPHGCAPLPEAAVHSAELDAHNQFGVHAERRIHWP